MGVMSIKEIIIDSLKYSFSDWKVVIALGLVLLFADIFDEISGTTLLAMELKVVLIILVFLLAIMEAGFVFRILHETISGSTKLPKFNNFKKMLRHGINELIILGVYFAVPVLLFLLFFVEFMNSMDLNDVPGASLNLFIILIAFTGFIYIIFPAVLLHRAHHNGDLKSSFDFRKIYHKIRRIGFKRLIFVYIGVILLVTLIESVLADSISSSIPLYGQFIADLIIAPLVLIFSARFLGLIDR